MPPEEGGAPPGGGRERLAPLYWSRAAAHIMVGRYRSAVKDCALALESAGDWEQVGGGVVSERWRRANMFCR